MLVAGSTLLLMMMIGTGLTTWTSLRLRFEERLAVGGVIGLVAVAATSFAAFEIGGMGAATLAVGLTVPGGFAAAGWWLRRDVMAGDARRAWHRLTLPAGDPRSTRPFAVGCVAAATLSTRVLALAYQHTPGGVRVGHLSGFGDWAAHLAYAGSFAYGDNRGLTSPIATGASIGYHFAADFAAALLTVGGAELTTSLALASWYVAVLIPPLMWCAVMRLTRSRATAFVSILLFTLSGGVGAWYFVGDVGDQGWQVLGALPRTYARMPEQQLWLDNTIGAALYAQRSTQLGIAIGLAVLIVVLAARPAYRRSGFAVAGVAVGLCGIVWAHMLLSAVALGAIAAWRDRRRVWVWFLAPAVAIGAPLMWSISPQRSSLRWDVGWMAPQAGQPWVVFWLRNAALFWPLFAAIMVWRGGLARLRVLSAPLWLWFVVPNLVAFHPWNWNNTKFFLFWQFAGSVVIASWAVGAARATVRRRRWPLGVLGAVAVCVLVASMVVTGALDTLRATQRSSAIEWVDDDDVVAARWLRQHARRGDVLVYGATNTSAVAALSGVAAVSGYPGWTADLSIADWSQRWQDSASMLRGDPDAASLVMHYGVDYVVIGPTERAEMGADDEYWEANATLVFASGEHRIYRT